MPEIKFTATPELPRDIAHLAYKAGDVVDLPDDSCRRWIRRGVAVFHVRKAAEMPQMIAPVAIDVAPLLEPEVVEPEMEVVADEPAAESANESAAEIPPPPPAEHFAFKNDDGKRRGRARK